MEPVPIQFDLISPNLPRSTGEDTENLHQCYLISLEPGILGVQVRSFTA
jgi:hypothetical protein